MDELRTLSPAPTWHPCHGGLDELVRAVRPVVQRRADWQETAELVAAELGRHLPAPDILTPVQRTGEAAGYGSYVLHTESDGTFSVVVLVRRPGQMTPIHESPHVVRLWSHPGSRIRGALHPRRGEQCLVEVGKSSDWNGDVRGFAPPGDIRRVRNLGTTFRSCPAGPTG